MCQLPEFQKALYMDITSLKIRKRHFLHVKHFEKYFFTQDVIKTGCWHLQNNNLDHRQNIDSVRRGVTIGIPNSTSRFKTNGKDGMKIYFLTSLNKKNLLCLLGVY